jgi:hypothetical protein
MFVVMVQVQPKKNYKIEPENATTGTATGVEIAILFPENKTRVL